MGNIKHMTSKRILVPAGDRELISTEFRILKCLEILAEYGYYVDILTYDEELLARIKEKCKIQKNINILLTKCEHRFWTMVQRDSFSKSFIKLYHDIIVPGTDFKFWEQVALDDFLWHVSSDIFPKINTRYDLVLFPLPSFDEPPPTTCDVFYTNVIYYAKENKIPIAALQIFPIYDIPPIFLGIIDYFIVREKYEKDFYESIGIKEEKVFILEDIKEAYSISTVEDSYKNLMFNQEISVDGDTLGIVIINHPKNRVQLYEIIDVIADLEIKKSVYFVFRNYAVRDLHENDIFNDFIRPVLEKKLKRFYMVEAGGAIKALMNNDVIISTNYALLLSFANRYNKTGIVYNPLKKEVSQIKDVVFTNSKRTLKEALLNQYKKKQETLTVGGIIKRILGK